MYAFYAGTVPTTVGYAAKCLEEGLSEVRTRVQKMASCLWWKGRPAGEWVGKRADLMSLIRRYPLVSFFVLAVALSWWSWILYSFDLAPTPIVGFGPFLAALVVLAVTEGKSGVVGLLRRMVRWRVGLRWYAVALLLPVVVTLTAAAQQPDC
jgi:hypothetical protein